MVDHRQLGRRPLQGDDNSLAFYQCLYEHLHRDVVGATASVLEAEYLKDIAAMRQRSSSEGLSFFTKTLPRLGKAVDKALSTGHILQFSSFAKKKGTELPAYCWWLFSMVFDIEGRERSDASPVALKGLRQLLYLFYKLALPYDDETTNRVISDFEANDAAMDIDQTSLTG